MVVVVSDDYLQSKECDFQTKFALSLSPGKLSPSLATGGRVGGASGCQPSFPRDHGCDTEELLWVTAHLSAFCVGEGVPGMLTCGRAVVNPWSVDWPNLPPSPPLWDEGLVLALHPLACRSPSEATDPRQVQGNEKRVPEHPAVHHCL